MSSNKQMLLYFIVSDWYWYRTLDIGNSAYNVWRLVYDVAQWGGHKMPLHGSATVWGAY